MTIETWLLIIAAGLVLGWAYRLIREIRETKRLCKEHAELVDELIKELYRLRPGIVTYPHEVDVVVAGERIKGQWTEGQTETNDGA